MTNGALPRALVFLCLCVSTVAGVSSAAHANSVDLFADSKIKVTSYSALNACGFNINSMFAGGPAASCRGARGAHEVIFASRHNGSRDTVTFHTTSSVFVSSLELFISGNCPAHCNTRSIGSFTFSYKSAAGVWTVATFVKPKHPEPNEIVLNLASPIEAKYFRATFTEYGKAGPRILGLEAFSQPIVTPEPASFVLLGSGLLVLMGRKVSKRYLVRAYS